EADGGGDKTVDAERLIISVETCMAGACSTSEHLSTDGSADGGSGELLSLIVESHESSPSCARARAARLVDKELSPLWAPLGNEACFVSPLIYQGIARPGAADTTPGAAF